MSTWWYMHHRTRRWVLITIVIFLPGCTYNINVNTFNNCEGSVTRGLAALADKDINIDALSQSGLGAFYFEGMLASRIECGEEGTDDSDDT